jgi:hypothetical protein
LLVRSRVLIESGQAAAAVPLLEELLAKDPHDFESRYRLALGDIAVGNFEKITICDEKSAEPPCRSWMDNLCFPTCRVAVA